MQKKRAILIKTLLATSLSTLMTIAMAQSSLSGFEQALKDKGWSVQQDEAGNLTLYPQNTAQSVAEENSSSEQQWQQMQSELEAAGWTVEREADGTLLLTPPSQVTPVSPETIDPMQDMKQKLRAAGWVVSNSPDGSMLLYPPGKTLSAKPKATAGTPPLVKITLPVNSWQEAHDISHSWLKAQPDFQATIGKIRKIFRVYLVSIVSENPPHNLIQQIAIRSSDGAVIVLN